ncbi:MAG: hypothetical protein GY732_08020, partial [Gammaproteobacteria bacterium]|nr:hypothetical protein [Gammaproteobacteria bacterium]
IRLKRPKKLTQIGFYPRAPSLDAAHQFTLPSLRSVKPDRLLESSVEHREGCICGGAGQGLFIDFQYVLHNKAKEIVAVAYSMPIFWDKNVSLLSENGFDWVFKKAIDDKHKNIGCYCEPNVWIRYR